MPEEVTPTATVEIAPPSLSETPTPTEGTPDPPAVVEAPIIPDSPDKYEIKVDFGKDFPDANMDEETKIGWQSTFHKAGLTQAQVDNLTEYHTALMLPHLEAMRDAAKAQVETEQKYVKDLFGTKLETVTKSATAMVNTVVAKHSPELAKQLTDSPQLVSNPYVLQLLNIINNTVNPSTVAPAVGQPVAGQSLSGFGMDKTAMFNKLAATGSL
jgi:hypothetical protein